MAPSSCDVGGREDSNGCKTEFRVKQKSKNGEAIELTLSSLSPLFSLHLSDAAKELGISKTSLKKACRFFGIERWPGRKVRGLESAIDGIERTRKPGADSEGAGMGSEIPKLQQELDELCHGTPEQITEKMNSPAVTAANVYRRLYSVHGWRSEFHNSGRRDINTGNQSSLTSGLAPPSTGETSPEANQPTSLVDKESPRPSPRKCVRPGPRRILRFRSRLGSRASEMKAIDLEGLLPEVHGNGNEGRREVPESVVQHGNNTLPPKTEIGEEGTGDGEGALVEEGAAAGERSAKRPKTQLLCAKCGKIKLHVKFCAPAF